MPPFPADGRARTVAASHFHRVVEREQLVRYRGEYAALVSSGQIGAADGAAKQRIAGDQLVFRGGEQADAALGMPRRVQDLKSGGGKLDHVAVPDGNVDLGLLRDGAADPRGLRIEHIAQRDIVFVHIDGGAGSGAQPGRAADVVDMGMRNDDAAHLQSVPFQDGFDALDFVAGIDHEGAARLLVAQNRAVALQSPHGQNFVNHRWYANSFAVQGYQALHESAAQVDISSRGRIRATGEDRVRLLHAVAANALDNLAPGRGAYTFFLNAQGRIQADGHVFVAADHVLLDCEPACRGRLREHLESFIVMDDVTLEDVTEKTCAFAVAGPRAAAAAAALCGRAPRGDLEFLEADGVRAARVPLAGNDGFRLTADSGKRGAILRVLERSGVAAASPEDFEIVRVESGVPRWGIDYGPENIPHETRQLHAVSFTKGCYTGQEIVERVRTQGRVNRLLVGLQLDAASTPENLEVRHEGRAVGKMTSAVFSPRFRKTMGFAIVRRAAASPGTRVTVGGTPALVTDVSRQGKE